jgi:hypothetical protein
VIGGAILIWSLRELRHAVQSATWPVVRGTIQSSAVKSEFDSTGDLPALPLYSASIRYQYEVDGKQYQGRRLAFGPITASSRKSPAQAESAAYPLGGVVEVRFCPSQPSLSVLTPGANWDMYAACALGVTFVGIGFGLLVR